MNKISEQRDFGGIAKTGESTSEAVVKHEQLRNFALETMADLAKTELGIDIRKNFGAKQPGKSKMQYYLAGRH